VKKIFTNFLLSYISLSVALLAIFLGVSVNIFNILRINAYNEGYSHLSTGMEIFDSDLNRIWALISTIGNYESVKKTAALNTPLTPAERYAMDLARMDMVNVVQAFSSDMIVDYGIVFQNGLCITANRVFDSFEDCFGVFLRFPEWEQEIRNIPTGFSSSGEYFTPESKYFSGIIFWENLQFRYVSYTSNKVFFIINTDLLLRNWLSNDINQVELYNQGRQIGSYGNFDTGVKYQKIEYFGSMGFRGSAYIPDSVIWDKMKPGITYTSICIFFFLVTGFGLSVYFSRRHSRPLQKIASQLMQQNNIPSLPANELLYIIHSVEQMGADLKKTQTTLHEQDRLLRLGMFECLLNGLVYSRTEWEQARSMFNDFPEVWCLCLIRGDEEKNETPQSMRSGVHLLAQMISEHFPAHLIVHYSGNDSAVIILPITTENSEPESYENILTKTAELMRTRHQLHISIAISGIFGSIEQLSAAYRQTRQLLRIAGKNTGKCLFYMGDEEAKENLFPMEFSDSQRFYELLLATDIEHASFMIRHSFDQYKDRGFVHESVIYHLFWSFEQVFVRIHAENSADPEFHFDLPVYDSQNTIEELTEKILLAAAAICNNIEKSSHRRKLELNMSITKYIDENITDPMLNLSTVSAAFGLSERYTQAIIRSHTSKSFFDYVDQKRIKMAHTLLTESSLSVNEIAVKCGYALPNSFYKSFKRHFGIPPTELRKPLK
jgi:AraC-like DNA-binding protein